MSLPTSNNLASITGGPLAESKAPNSVDSDTLVASPAASAGIRTVIRDSPPRAATTVGYAVTDNTLWEEDAVASGHADVAQAVNRTTANRAIARTRKRLRRPIITR